jgi:hypothetical protein
MTPALLDSCRTFSLRKICSCSDSKIFLGGEFKFLKFVGFGQAENITSTENLIKKNILLLFSWPTGR